MTNIAWFKELSKEDTPFVGGKASNLGEMYNAGIPVPPGFVVTTDAYKHFLESTGIADEIYSILKDLNVEDNETLQLASKKIQEIIVKAEMPRSIANEIKDNYDNLNVNEEVFRTAGKQALDIIKAGRELPFVAVRSSASAEDLPTASFAGQMATFLNIRGSKKLVEAVQKCWASLFTARAIYYRVKNNFPHEKVFIAVVVQKMINSAKSGVIFSINPMTNDDNEIVIEAGWGLGEAVVSGSINPDQYIVDKKTLDLKSKRINEQEWMYTLDPNLGYTVKKNVSQEKINAQILNDSEIRKLAELTNKIEQHYNFPQDIEYAIEGSNIYIVQSRPVTTLKKPSGKKEEIEKEEAIVAAESAEVLVQGVGASPGVGSGAVKIVRSIEDLGKVLQGDILVTKMTNPDMVPTMQRASAIVTDAGGATCFSGKTKVLTNEGFMTMENVFDKLSKGKPLSVVSFNPKTFKNEWKPIKNPIKRKSKIWKIFVSQTGRAKQNYLEITPNHKMVALDGRNLIEKEINKIITGSEMVLVADKIPSHFNPHEINEPHLSYLCGALFTDGYIQVNNRRGRVVLTQKEIPEKREFINTVKNYFYEIFKTSMNYSRTKRTSGVIRGKEIHGEASDFICSRKEPALKLNDIKTKLVEWVLHLNEESLKSFLGGVIDGDGAFNVKHCSGRIHIYAGKQGLAEAVILACLRLGILPQVSIQRDICYNIQIVDEIEEILKNTKRVKGYFNKKINGTKLFSAKQLLKDIDNLVNYKGRIKPYIKNNLLLDANKIRERILPMLKDKKLADRMGSIINSEFRMQRIVKEKDFEKIEYVYNFEVKDNHTYLVFTENYTPVIVWNCHAAIVSREMGVPCIVGTEAATQSLNENEVVTVDANSGKVYKGKITIERKKEAYELEQAPLETVTSVKVIMDLPDFAEKAARTGADGIGLLRCEFMILKHKAHPMHMIETGRREELVDDLTRDLTKIASAFKGKPVWYRTLDAPTDEFRSMEGGENEPEEDNPMMGWRSIRRSLDQPEMLLAEFEAIKRVHDSGLTNVGIMLPLVTHVEQISEAKKYLREVGLEPMENIEFGIMVETPAAVQIIEEICKEGIDFISFGTNDLTQFTLACDRNSARVQKWYNEKHPAVLRQIKQVIDVCKKYNVETSICGQAGSDSEMAELLVRMGIDSISANPDAVKKIRYNVAKAEKRLLLDVARRKVNL